MPEHRRLEEDALNALVDALVRRPCDAAAVAGAVIEASPPPSPGLRAAAIALRDAFLRAFGPMAEGLRLRQAALEKDWRALVPGLVFASVDDMRLLRAVAKGLSESPDDDRRRAGRHLGIAIETASCPRRERIAPASE